MLAVRTWTFSGGRWAHPAKSKSTGHVLFPPQSQNRPKRGSPDRPRQTSLWIECRSCPRQNCKVPVVHICPLFIVRRHVAVPTSLDTATLCPCVLSLSLPSSSVSASNCTPSISPPLRIYFQAEWGCGLTTHHHAPGLWGANSSTGTWLSERALAPAYLPHRGLIHQPQRISSGSSNGVMFLLISWLYH